VKSGGERGIVSGSIITDKVRRNFSRGAKDYDSAASFQRYAAGCLTAKLQEAKPRLPSQPGILELGCGTGFVTEPLLELFPGAALTACDLSQAMLDVCRKKVTEKYPGRTVVFERGDLRDYTGGARSFDIVISGMALQWLNDLGAVLRGLYGKVNTGGGLFFSCPLEGSLRASAEAFEAAGYPWPGPKMPSEADLRTHCSGFGAFKMEVFKHSEKYDSFLHMLDALRKTGAVNPGGKVTPPSAIRRAAALCQKDVAGMVTADYVFAVCSSAPKRRDAPCADVSL
jgi:malonyl-CoA O-methyltransferase